MKTFKARIKFVGLAGKYISEFEVKARNKKSAENKAYMYVGDRSYNYVKVWEVK